jgi:hypothetical protein
MYRLASGDVKQFETLARVASAMDVPVNSLLGGEVIEHFTTLEVYLNRIREIEQLTSHACHLSSPLFYPATSSQYDVVLRKVHDFVIQQTPVEYQSAVRSLVESVWVILRRRKQDYEARMPSVRNLIVSCRLKDLLTTGIARSIKMPDALRRSAREVVAHEVMRMTKEMEQRHPQIEHALLDMPGMASSFGLLTNERRTYLVSGPISDDAHPLSRMNIATVTTSKDSVQVHQAIADMGWARCMTGERGASIMRDLVSTYSCLAPATSTEGSYLG